MKNILVFITILLVQFVFSVQTAYAVPDLISYQGQLNDDSGSPINGSRDFVFSIYDVASSGTALWTENQTIGVTNGVFNVQLGASSPISPQVFDNELLYLGIKVESDVEMVPRQQITSSAFSQKTALSTLRIRGAPGIGGDGHDGDFVSTGAHTFERGRVYQFNSFELQAGHVITATGGTSNADPIVVRIKGDAVIAGTIDLSGAGMGSEEDTPDTLESGKSTGGGGGGGAGAFGSGFSGASDHGISAGGNWLLGAGLNSLAVIAGAGGGQGQNMSLTRGGFGGSGGGALALFIAGDTTITGVVSVAGTVGEEGPFRGCTSGGCYGTGGGGGGGGGSAVIYHSGSFTDSEASYFYLGGSGGIGGMWSVGGPGPSGGTGGSGKIQIIQVKED